MYPRTSDRTRLVVMVTIVVVCGVPSGCQPSGGVTVTSTVHVMGLRFTGWVGGTGDDGGGPGLVR